MSRPGWDEYFLTIATAVGERGNCTRRQVGAVITRSRRIVATGYNGAPAKLNGCLDGACPRGRHYEAVAASAHATGIARCACGKPFPCPEYVSPGSDYGNCLALHAELNACVYAGRERSDRGIIYITDEPCHNCWKVIQAAGILRAVFPEGNAVISLDFPFISR